MHDGLDVMYRFAKLTLKFIVYTVWLPTEMGNGKMFELMYYSILKLVLGIY